MRFSIGTDDFKKIRTEKSSEGQLSFYCDKSLLIKDIIDDGTSVFVFPRPKRFGKTLNLSMLKYFFDIEQPENTELFAGLSISEHKKIMDEWQGKYPVVFISFKSLKCESFEKLEKALKVTLSNCYRKHKYLLTSEKLDELDREKIRPYFSKDFEESDFTYILKDLTEMLQKHYGKEAVVLIDEYDTPLQEAYLRGFYETAITPLRNMLGEVLKGNDYLFKGVVTGITRIARESLFSGVNNLNVYDITSNQFAQYFGFTEQEIKSICDPTHLDDLKSWYNGYTFGDDLIIYNPWSVLNFLSRKYKFAPYWINTSSNDLIREMLTADKLENVKALIEGQSIDIEIEPFTVMDNLKGNNTAFWNLLFMSGFLTLDADKKMRIPNKEILYFFEKVVMEWFERVGNQKIIQDFLRSLLMGQVDSVQYYLQLMITDSFGIRDMNIPARESFYHGFLLGLILGLRERYEIKSNHESGKGYYDIALFPNDPIKDVGIVIEVKFKKSVEAALQQIEKQDYAAALKSRGCKNILAYGFAFDGKDVEVRLL
jgi:hypothetical protein